MKPIVAVHGGAGLWGVDNKGDVVKALREAVEEGLLALSRGSALDGVVAAMEKMETSGVFNAGYGSAYATDGRVLMDAGVMDGRTRRAGAVAAVEGVKSAVRLARAVMDETDHVIIAGRGPAFWRLGWVCWISTTSSTAMRRTRGLESCCKRPERAGGTTRRCCF